MRIYLIGAVMACTVSTAALAAPGLGDEIYGATVESGEFEAESRYGSLVGGPDDGEDTLKLEVAYGVNDRFRIGVVAEFEKEPVLPRKAEALAIEAIYELGRVGTIDIAAYAEYEIALDGTDKIETKLLFQRRKGPLDIRFNLIAEKPLDNSAQVALEYAISADIETFGELRLGVAAFGELGTFSHFLPDAEHFAGPVAKLEIEGLGPELELQAGYLFALGKAKNDTNGQLRLTLGLEF